MGIGHWHPGKIVLVWMLVAIPILLMLTLKDPEVFGGPPLYHTHRPVFGLFVTIGIPAAVAVTWRWLTDRERGGKREVKPMRGHQGDDE